ncbi:MAG: 4-carboxymuconolactone decarboxylase [Alphaproteobacteria bacterium]|nr:4-carboxymuconolactone decarboxylase [Alphaproteobacteria bacterium]
MDRGRHDLGLAVRKEVMGEDYVARTIAGAGAFGADFQEMINEHCWGNTWARPGLGRAKRSLLNLGMLAALGRMTEFETHFRGAITNGMSLEELKEALRQIAVYCGIPCGVECHRAAKRVLDQLAAEKAGAS